MFLQKVQITKVDYELNKDMVNLSVNLKDGPEGSIVDVDAELFKAIPDEIYVSLIDSSLAIEWVH